MITKRDLVEAINDLSHDLMSLSFRVNELRKEVEELKSTKVKVAVKPTKKHIGRPLGSKDKKPRAKRAPISQARDKSGKFAKK